MPTLTIEAIRKNPWNVLIHTLPPRPSRLLLETAWRAADYCNRSELALMLAARAGLYVPEGWDPIAAVSPDVHEESELCQLEALDHVEEICATYEKEFGEALKLLE